MHEQVIHQVDDRAAVDHRLDVGQVDFGGVGLKLDGGFVEVSGDRIDFEAFFVATGQRALDAAAKREHGPHMQVGDSFDFVELFEILRVGHGDADRVADFEEGDCVEPLGNFAWQQAHGDRVDHAVAEAHGRNAQVAFDERQDRVFLHHAHFDECFAEAEAFLRAFGEG